jgi:hypothetical protein
MDLGSLFINLPFRIERVRSMKQFIKFFLRFILLILNSSSEAGKTIPRILNGQLETDSPKRIALIVDNIYSYYQKLRNERESETVLTTPDGIGVVYPQNEKGDHQTVKLGLQQTLYLEDFESIFKLVIVVSKLAFLRDAQSKGLIYDNEELKRFLKEQLIMMGLKDEAVRIEYPTYTRNYYYELNYRIGISMIPNDIDSEEEK